MKWKSCSFIVLLVGLLGIVFSSHAQYFGQNKVRYKTLDFKVYQTPHFELYYYLNNEALVKRFAQEAEVWYHLHKQVFRDTFAKRNPIILYANSPDFHQTTAIEGEIGVGTGGVTEGMKNRIVMPITQLNTQTRHVIGHELVHAFQYRLLLDSDSTNIENINKIPLWMIEGMAEYLSVGKLDAYTSMWIRDAYLSKNIPSLQQLTSDPKYFPYRYGQAFWSYVGATYGDSIIVPFFKTVAKQGYSKAIQHIFGYDEHTFSKLWKTSIESAYKCYAADTAQVIVGKRIIDHKNGGDHYNVAPAISPDGKYVAFLSEKDLLSIDLFLADAQTGKIIRKLTSKTRHSHIDEFNFVESAGAWSPDGSRFAFSTFSAGRNQLVIISTTSGKIIQMESMKEVEEFGNLSWSPDGTQIVFSGLKHGQSDLFLFNLSTKKITQLTNDKYSNYQPCFSRDGKKIAFSSDRTALDQAHNKAVVVPLNLAIIDVATQAITDIIVFSGANNLNPQFSADDQSIYFLSNRDGFRNLYRYGIYSGKLEQLTKYFTGISGITEFSPALSISNYDDIVYSYYQGQRYIIYNAKATEFTPKSVNSNDLNLEAAILPPSKASGVDIINANLSHFDFFEKIDPTLMTIVPYRPKFKLDYISSNGVGASVGSFYGVGMSSGAQGVFSDITGQNQLFAAVALNGQIYDFGGQIAYTRKKSRIDWGASISHIPYVSGATSSSLVTRPDTNTPVYDVRQDLIRTFEEQIGFFASYPFSRVHRFELGNGFIYYNYRIDRYHNYYQYDADTKVVGSIVETDKEKLSSEEITQSYGSYFKPFSTFQLNAAFIGDNSFFGLAAPLHGFRYRIGLETYLWDRNLSVSTIDLRRYIRVKPVTFAFRLYHYNRFGRDEKKLYPLYVGYDNWVRGYNPSSFTKHQSSNSDGFNINQLVGSKIAVANFEMRLPFTGPKRLAVIPSGFVFTDLNLFFDIGLAYYSDSEIALKTSPGVTGVISSPSLSDPNATTKVYQRIPVMSTGISMRFNLFGAIILEPYFAIPFTRTDITGGVFGLAFAPGW